MKKDIKVPAYIRKRVLTDIGQASMCWDDSGTFDTIKAIEIADALCQYIVVKIEKEKE
jgi:hypothetical protein